MPRGLLPVATVNRRAIAVISLLAGSGLTMALSAPSYAIVGGLCLVGVVFQSRISRWLDRPLALWAALAAVAPLATGGFLPPLAAAVFAIPALIVLDNVLEQTAPSGGSAQPRPGLTPVALRLAVLWAMFVLLGMAWGIPALTLSGVLATFWLTVSGGRAWRQLRLTTADAQVQLVRVVAGTPTHIPITLSGDGLARAIVQVSCKAPWVAVEPQLQREPSNVTVYLTVIAEQEAAPLAVELQIALWDRRMLVCRSLRTTVATVVVIPRARYAEWLARSFLKGDRGVNVVSSIETMVSPGQGSNRELYQFHRPYQPGDPTRDVDWKRVREDGRLSVREFRTASAHQILLCVNLAAGSLAEADRLALDLVLAAVTLAREGSKVAIIWYSTPDQPVEVTEDVSGPALMRQALTHLAQITRTGGPERLLALPNPTWLERVARSARSPAVQRLAASEVAFVKQRAAEHPLFQVLEPRLRLQQATGSVVLLSSLRDDAEAVAALRVRAEQHGMVLRICRPGDLWTTRTVRR